MCLGIIGLAQGASPLTTLRLAFAWDRTAIRRASTWVISVAAPALRCRSLLLCD